jgi:hypothetical protein
MPKISTCNCDRVSSAGTVDILRYVHQCRASSWLPATHRAVFIMTHMMPLHPRVVTPPTWHSLAGIWHVGAKRTFELFPGGLEKRIKGERKKRFAEEQRAALTAATAAAAAAPKVGNSPQQPALPQTGAVEFKAL